MLNFVKGFIKDEEGMGTIEIVIIIGVLVALALLFKSKVMEFASGLMEKLFKVEW